MQLEDLGEAANEPLGHNWHPSPVLPIEAKLGALPAGQGVQSATEAAAGLEFDGMNWVPAGQLAHLDLVFALVALKKVLGPQTQSESFVDPKDSVVLPSGQTLHSPLPLVRQPSWYRPGGQGTHREDP